MVNNDSFVFSLLVMPAVIVRQRKPYRRKDGVVLYFEGKLFYRMYSCGQNKVYVL